MAAERSAFQGYLKRAIDHALVDEKTGDDEGNLKMIRDRAGRGVRQNWTTLTARTFLAQFLWCVGSIQKPYARHERYFRQQRTLFKQCHAHRIVQAADSIRAEWLTRKCDLNSRMFEAVMKTATSVANDWTAFKGEYLLLPKDPETESVEQWLPAHAALDSLPMVGNATAWYLIRNLYGAPFFKPDLHINAIEKHFFCSGNLNEMSAAVRQLWPKVCTDSRISPVHLGVVDYILWWYREETGDPSNK